MRSKKFKILFIFFLVNLTCLLNAHSLEHKPEIRLQAASFTSNDSAVLSFTIESAKPVSTPEPFRCEIKFDENNLKYRKINCKGNIKRSDIKTEINKGFLNLIFNPKKEREMFFEDDKSEIFELVFTVKNKANPGVSLIHADFKNLYSDLVEYSSNFEITIDGNPEIKNCKLKDLVPEIGKLSPEFDPDIFQYSMEVPAQTKFLDFDAVPESENLSVKISRRKLAAAGKNTCIKITVSNKELKVKSLYNIEVKRRQKDSEKTENLKSSDDNIPEAARKNDEPSKYDRTEDETQEGVDELDNENTQPGDSPAVSVYENSSFKIYMAVIFCLIAAAAMSYFIIKFIKSRKKLS